MRKIIIFLFYVLAVSGCSLPQSTPPSLPVPVTPVMLQAQATPTFAPSATPTITPAAISGPPSQNQPTPCQNPYYPVVNDATFFYHVSTGTNVIQTMVADNSSGVFTITVRSVDMTAHIEGQCTDKGIVLMQNPGSQTTTSDESGSSTVTSFTNSGVSLPNDVAPGSQWSQTLSVTTSLGTSFIESTYVALGFENIVVPAGNFRALKVEQSGYATVFGHKVKMHGFLWYAEGVGVVRSAMDGAPVLELTMYDFPE
ncbi:MAG: hypothetical protein DDG60_02885 [Anaerolineae bacterium]|nr:MAG: hypothetical protein DDG60_02885 [Anaerolineae bacterium]